MLKSGLARLLGLQSGDIVLGNFCLELVVILLIRVMVVSFLGGYGYRTGAISAFFLYQIFCEAFHGGKKILDDVYGYKSCLIFGLFWQAVALDMSRVLVTSL